MEDNNSYDSALPIISKKEAQAVYDIQKEILASYVKSKDKMPLEDWLYNELKKQLPNKPSDEISIIQNDIISSLKITEEKKQDLEKAIAKGRDKESWLAANLVQYSSQQTTQSTGQYLQKLDDAINTSNKEMLDTITTQSGNINMNMNLDGFIAEQHHVNSFNQNAALSKSNYHAEVLKPKPGKRYAANSVDVVIKDSSGKIVRKYQVKYGATAEETIKMIKDGHYPGQQLIVPPDQVEEVQKAFPNRKVSSTISEDGVSSEPLSKKDAKKKQQEAQNKEFIEDDWSKYSSKDLAKGIIGEVGKATLMGAATGAGMNIIGQIRRGDDIDGEEVVKTAVETGADFGVKTAVASGLKVASEKGLLTVIPKGTPAATFANIAYVGVENVKIMGKVVSGELSPREGLDKMEQTTVACAAGIAASAKGAALGASLGSVFGPVGTAVGGFIGGTVGYIAGSKVGETVVKGYQKVRDTATSIIKTITSPVKTFVSAVSSVCSSIESFFGW